MKEAHLGGTKQDLQRRDDFIEVMNSVVRGRIVEIIKWDAGS